jgi:hypothetical protein
MPRIYSYRKFTDQYTTYTAVDKGEEDKRITELCTINGDTYISVPDDLTLPEQPKQIKLEPVVITEELKEQIEDQSPHIQLIKKRIRERIAKEYSIEDELKIIRNKINGIDVDKYTKYNSYVESCIADGEIKVDILVKKPIKEIKEVI